jgi:hypothetical protein
MIARFVFASLLLMAPLPVSAAVVFDDDFEYVANRSDTDVQIPFESAGWTDAKAENSDYGSSGGYLYTQDDATRGSKVLVMESLPTTVGGQTSYHLSYGSDASALGTIPANVWIQFWTYAEPGSEWDRQKFLYPCHQEYPCPVGSFLWLVGLHDRDFTGVSDNETTAPTGGRFFRVTSAYANNSAATTNNEQKLYHNLGHNPLLVDTWYQVKIHIDTSGAQGTYELWVRQRGVSTWTKEAEWIGGVTANFDWPIPAGDARLGNRVLAMPTTVDTLDSTTYMDDFVMATSESDLPATANAPSSTVSGSARFTGAVRIQ